MPVILDEVVESPGENPTWILQVDLQTPVVLQRGAAPRAACTHSGHRQPLRRPTRCCRDTRPPRRRPRRSRPRSGRVGAARRRARLPDPVRLRAPSSRRSPRTRYQHEHQRREQRLGARVPFRALRSEASEPARQSWPRPRSPSAATRTCQAPAVIIQRLPVNSRGSDGRTPCDVRHRRELGAGTGERQRHDPDLVHIVAGGENLDLRDAGNRVRRPDGDQQAVRTGHAVEEDVGAADVCRTRQRRARGQRKSREVAAESPADPMHGAAGKDARVGHHARDHRRCHQPAQRARLAASGGTNSNRA